MTGALSFNQTEQIALANKKDLAELDSLYKQAILGLPESVRIDYCHRLVERCNYDLAQKIDSGKKKELKALIVAAKLELKRMRE